MAEELRKLAKMLEKKRYSTAAGRIKDLAKELLDQGLIPADLIPRGTEFDVNDQIAWLIREAKPVGSPYVDIDKLLELSVSSSLYPKTKAYLEDAVDAINEFGADSIYHLGLPPRYLYKLARARINTISQVEGLGINRDNWLKIRQLADKGREEIVSTLRKFQEVRRRFEEDKK